MKHQGNELVNNSETEPTNIVIKCILPHGLGYGEGGISVQEQIKQGILTAEVPAHVHEVLVNDPNSFKPVETDDDGCGDGRPWIKIIRRENKNGSQEVVEYKKSLLRAKVFGGGLVTAASMWRSIIGTPSEGSTVTSDRAFMSERLEEHGISHGAHTDDHATGDKCGCGAIDNYTLVTANSIKYRQQITSTLEALYGDSYSQNIAAVERVFDNYESLIDDEAYLLATGKQSMEQILESGAVVKELYGQHEEETIVINEIEGTTLDQQYFTKTVKDMSVDKPEVVQAFVVDAWRGRQIAETVALIAEESGVEISVQDIQRIAYADFLIRTLAVAATLTAGDLPVYRRSSN